VTVLNSGVSTIIEKGRFAFLSALNLTSESLLSSGVKVAYKKHNSLSFTAKTLDSTTTTLKSAAASADTTFTLTDSSSFPPYGQVKIGSTVREYTTNNVSTGIITLTLAVGEIIAIDTTVTRIDWINLSSNLEAAVSATGTNTYYLILFTPTELDVLETFEFMVSEGTHISRTVIDIVPATGVDTESAPSVSACILKDHIVGLDGTPAQNVSVYARLLALPTLVSSVGMLDQAVSATTDANGFFQLSVPQGATLDVTIPAIGYRRTIVVPSATLANLFEIA